MVGFVEVLLEAKCNVHDQTSQGASALDLACEAFSRFLHAVSCVIQYCWHFARQPPRQPFKQNYPSIRVSVLEHRNRLFASQENGLLLLDFGGRGVQTLKGTKSLKRSRVGWFLASSETSIEVRGYSNTIVNLHARGCKLKVWKSEAAVLAREQRALEKYSPYAPNRQNNLLRSEA
eukprot:4538834-Amphidinium_carterae.1